MPASSWPPSSGAPSTPPAGVAAPAATLFVDGVRRVDAQVWVDDPEAQTPARPVRLVRRGRDLLLPRRRRPPGGAPRCGAASSRRPSTPSTSSPAAGRYAVDVDRGEAEPAAGAGAEPAGAGPAQRGRGRSGRRTGAGTARGATTTCSSSTARCAAGDRLPATSATSRPTTRPTWSPDQNAVVAALGPGQRTPMFRLTSTGGWSRYTWYLRLPCPPGAPWAGIVRLECSAEPRRRGGGGARAGARQVTLARYASAGLQGLPRPAEPVPDRRPRAMRCAAGSGTRECCTGRCVRRRAARSTRRRAAWWIRRGGPSLVLAANVAFGACSVHPRRHVSLDMHGKPRRTSGEPSPARSRRPSARQPVAQAAGPAHRTADRRPHRRLRPDHPHERPAPA